MTTSEPTAADAIAITSVARLTRPSVCDLSRRTYLLSHGIRKNTCFAPASESQHCILVAL